MSEGRPEGTREYAPSPQLSAVQVVERVLDACTVSSDEAAFALWAFSAPRFRLGLGDASHLATILGNELFRPLITFSAIELAPLERIEHAARQVVTVESEQGERVPFLISLSLGGQLEYPGCWLISGIERA